MVRKYIRTERRMRGWNQSDLAREAGIKSKTTIVDLEAGRRLSEGYEGAVERALGWRIGSLDRIREGGEPEYDTGTPGTPEDMPQDEWERELVREVPNMSRKRRIELFRLHRQLKPPEGPSDAGRTADTG